MTPDTEPAPSDLCITPPPVKASQNAAAALDGYVLTGTTSQGRHFTPPSVARLTAQFAGPYEPGQHIHDPTCGSAAMLVHAHHVIQDTLDDSGAVTEMRFTGQELNRSAVTTAETTAATLGLDFDIRQGDALTNPQFTTDDALDPVDRVVANIPFSVSWDHDTAFPDPYNRFSWTDSPPPESRADFAFLQHIVAQLTDTGRAAVIVPHSILHRKADKRFRKYIVEAGVLDAVVDLPSGVFPDTGTKVSIMVLDTGTEHQHPENVFMAMLTEDECVEVDDRLVIPEEIQEHLITKYREHTMAEMADAGSDTAVVGADGGTPGTTPADTAADESGTESDAEQANATLDEWT